MDTRYEPSTHEQKIYELWEKGNYFSPDTTSKQPRKPFTILLPPPNASGKMHTGNVLMIAIEDLLIRWKRMSGYAALWVPGTDHAGFETQVTFERELKKQGKSRFNYDRRTLYRMIGDFVHANKSAIDNQLRSMGASIDWSRYTFTLDDHVVKTVHGMFIKMFHDGLIYRDNYMVNYCPQCGTTFADLEIVHVERTDPLYYIRYRMIDKQPDESAYIGIATIRPETIFADTHAAVNPTDKKYQHLIGRNIENPLSGKRMNIIADTFVDPEFGTGIVKLTPAHDKNDYEAAKRHELPIVQAIDLSGKIMSDNELSGLKIVNARKKAVELLEQKQAIEKVNNTYTHSVATCYKAGHDIEPMIVPNWFIKVDDKNRSLKKPATDAVKKGDVKIFPKWREKTYLNWMKEMHDWPISRQIVWGIRIPVWYSVDENPDISVTFIMNDRTHHADQGSAPITITGTVSTVLKTYSIDEISTGLQSLRAPQHATFVIQSEKPEGNFLPETDTFDTWFSSGQWPLVTLGYPDSPDFKQFYPTDVLETGWEIIRLWVSRMIMFGIYATGTPPFHSVYLHGIVRARDGKKMSKSLGNVINPDDYQKQYGTDALRMGLISGTANGKDFNFPHDKILGYQKFANKLWNIGRYVELANSNQPFNHSTNEQLNTTSTSPESKTILKNLTKLVKSVTSDLEKYRFAQAAEDIYQFVWHELADKYIEQTKARQGRATTITTLNHVYTTCLKLLHPFMPFVTEAIWQELTQEIKNSTKPLIVETWPEE